MKYPRISVVTPSYNQAPYIRDTIESILDQQYPNMEYFVIDGGSSDGTQDIIREYQDRIDWWVSEKDKGQSDAINKGFRRSSGELLCWVNSDDVLFPGCLDTISGLYLQKGKPDILHANCALIDENGFIIRLYRLPRETRFFLNRGVWVTPPPAVFFKANLLRKVGYLDTKFQFSMDLDLWLRIIQAGGEIAFSPKYLGGFRWHQASKTVKAVMKKKKTEESPETREILDRTFASATADRRLFWRRVWKIYQLFNLSYLRSYIETSRVKGKHWKQAFNTGPAL